MCRLEGVAMGPSNGVSYAEGLNAEAQKADYSEGEEKGGPGRLTTKTWGHRQARHAAYRQFEVFRGGGSRSNRAWGKQARETCRGGRDED